MSVVVMTREMGTLGKDVAREFARRKGYSVFHHELVTDSRDRARRGGESEVYRFLEGSEAEIDTWRTNRAQDGYLTTEEVLEIALEGDVLIRGWGATKLLRSVPNVLSVRVCAPMENRIATMQERLGVDARTARREIERSDAAHSRTFLRFFEADWRDPANYDLVLNTAHVSPMTCAEILLDAVAAGTFEETDEMRRALGDMALEARVKALIAGEPSLSGQGRHIGVTVENARVRLYGVVSNGRSRRAAEELISRAAGVREVTNEIAEASGFVE